MYTNSFVFRVRGIARQKLCLLGLAFIYESAAPTSYLNGNAGIFANMR